MGRRLPEASRPAYGSEWVLDLVPGPDQPVVVDAFGEMLLSLFSASGEVPRKVKFHDFTLTYQGR